jgi:CPA2 family monovalent cation:H+ antiporter-2
MIVGYGPVGRVVDALLRDSGMETVVIDTNMDTVRSLTNSGRLAVFGDATQREILLQAGIARALHLVVTLPHSANRGPMVLTARELNPALEITVRARYLREHDVLEQAGVSKTVFEEGEAGIALAKYVLQRRGVPEATITRMLDALRRLWRIEE